MAINEICLPLFVVGVVALDVEDGCDAVETPNDEDHVVKHHGAEVTPVDVHAGTLGPLGGIDLPPLHGVESGYAIEST